MASTTIVPTSVAPKRRRRGLTLTFAALNRAKTTLGAGVFYAFLIALIVGALYPSMSQLNLDTYLSSSTLVGLLGTGSIKHISGFTALVGIELYSSFFGVIFGGIIAYIAGAALPATIDNGTLDLALARPISRTRYYLEMWLSALLGAIFLSVMTILAIWLGSLFVKTPDLDWQWLLITQLLGLAFFVCAAGIGAFFGSFINSSRAAGGTAVGVVALFYVISIVGSISNKLDWLVQLGQFHYFQTLPVLLQHDITWWHPVLLVGAGVVLALVGLFIFNRRDLPTT